MNTQEMKETRDEAQEIIHNVTADLRAGYIEFWQWWEVTRRALKDVFGAFYELKMK